jgi:ferritin-like metal-binding protein YciE
MQERQTTLHDLFVQELKDILDGERQLVKALPKLAKTAANADLKAGIEEHLEQTKGHVTRIERVFEMMGTKALGKKCIGIQGILEEGQETVSAQKDPELADAALIASCQKVEHYEIATYGTLCAWARTLEIDQAARLLEETLEEEKAADEKLTELAESSINASAV